MRQRRKWATPRPRWRPEPPPQRGPAASAAAAGPGPQAGARARWSGQAYLCEAAAAACQDDRRMRGRSKGVARAPCGGDIERLLWLAGPAHAGWNNLTLTFHPPLYVRHVHQTRRSDRAGEGASGETGVRAMAHAPPRQLPRHMKSRGPSALPRALERGAGLRDIGGKRQPPRNCSLAQRRLLPQSLPVPTACRTVPHCIVQEPAHASACRAP